MTGFGDAAAERDGTHYAVEIRSLNNRFFKPVIKLPDNVAGLEPELESMLREKLGRGSITYILKMRVDSAEAAYHINTEALNAYIDQLKKVTGLDGVARIDLASLVQLPGVCQEPHDDSDEIERHGPIVRELTVKAIDKLQSMRQREGKSLFDDLMKHAGIIKNELSEISQDLVAAGEHARIGLRECNRHGLSCPMLHQLTRPHPGTPRPSRQPSNLGRLL